MRRHFQRFAFLVGMMACGALRAQAAPTEVLEVDLPAMIDKVAMQHERFAVEVAKRFAMTTDGEWTASGSMRTWTYSVRVPTAVSLSFHASRLTLPPSAVLTVSGSRAQVFYRAADVRRSELWGRPLVGDTLRFSISVPAADVGTVALEVDGLQAGYRGLGGLPNHPHYTQLVQQSAGSPSACQENYSCDATTANGAPARAVVAILIGNKFQCTGTLLNDTANDLTPYILTARHCQAGTLGGGDPQAASSVAVYWDAVTPCGSTLGSIYDGTALAQFGATTVVEQQDAWLIRLDAAPVATDAYWAGWDATGGTFAGGYSIHHALGFNKQYVSWYGQALLRNISAATLNIGYASTFWGLVNQLGSVGAGASGGAVFDSNDRLVGSATLASLQSGPNSAGVCPLNPPPAPASSTIVADYTAFSAVFASTADTTSSTPNATLRSVLDPGATGRLVIDGVGVLPVTLKTSVGDNALTTLQVLTITWNAPGAQACTASGGVSGDGWAGSKAAAGSATIVNYTGGIIPYMLSCTGAGLVGGSTVYVDWIYMAPSAEVDGPQAPVAIGSTISLRWGSTILPCVASGGTPGDGWAGNPGLSDPQNVTVTKLGNVTYVLTCGTGPQQVTAQATVSVVPLSVTLSADSTQVRIGSYVSLGWTGPTSAANCSGAGGGPGDNWAQNVGLQITGTNYVTETSPGTYIYTINCSGAGQTATASVMVTFTSDPPAISLVAVMPTEQIYPQLTPIHPPVDLIWSSNVTSCFMGVAGPLGNTGVLLNGQYPSGTASDAQFMAGLYTYTLNCAGNLQATASIQWTTSNPQLTLTAPTTTWVANYPYAVYWNTNTQPCMQTGGVAGDGWAGNYQAGQASETVTESLPGTYVFTLTCGTGSSMAQAQLRVTVPPPAVTISVSPATVSSNSTFTLNWNSSLAPCSSVDPSGGVDWGGSLVSPTGSLLQVATTPGAFTYAITCGTGAQTVHASTQVIVTPPVVTTISANPGTAVVGAPVTLTWNANPAYLCTAVGGTGHDTWTGAQLSSGNASVTSATAGVVDYGISCSGTSSDVQVTYTPPSAAFPPNATPSVSLSSNLSTQQPGQSITLTWSSKYADACIAFGGSNGDGWNGSMPLAGSMAISESLPGAFSYDITCTGAPPSATAVALVTFGVTTESKSGGGGGSMDLVSLLLLILAVVRKVQTQFRNQLWRAGWYSMPPNACRGESEYGCEMVRE